MAGKLDDHAHGAPRSTLNWFTGPLRGSSALAGLVRKASATIDRAKDGARARMAWSFRANCELSRARVAFRTLPTSRDSVSRTKRGLMRFNGRRFRVRFPATVRCNRERYSE